MNTLPLAHLFVTFILDGKKYDAEQFMVEFSQPIDYKGQPQCETKGGQIIVNLTQTADDNLYYWAKKSTIRKNGKVLFQTDLGMTVLEVSFENAYCANLSRVINSSNGLYTELTIAPEKISMNGVKHNQFWAK